MMRHRWSCLSPLLLLLVFPPLTEAGQQGDAQTSIEQNDPSESQTPSPSRADMMRAFRETLEKAFAADPEAKVPVAQLPPLNRLIETLDKDKDGTIAFAEANPYLERLRQQQSRDRLVQMKSARARDVAALADRLATLFEANPEASIAIADLPDLPVFLERLDVDGNGAITLDEAEPVIERRRRQRQRNTATPSERTQRMRQIRSELEAKFAQNPDAKIPVQELSLPEKLLELMDRDGDGYLTKTELEPLLEREPPSTEERR